MLTIKDVAKKVASRNSKSIWFSKKLDDGTYKNVDKFEKNRNDEFKNYTWDIPKDDFETHFCKYNDVLGYIGCDCIDMNLVEFINQ